MVTKGGAKLLDFGLAEPQQAAAGRGAVTETALTENGMVVGTLRYMAPEQFAGGEPDERTDIFGLGVVLSELFGFTMEPHTAIGSSIASANALPTELSAALPSPVRWIVLGCLARDADARWQHASDVRMALQHVAEDLSAQVVSSPKRFLVPSVVVLGSLLLAAVGLSAWLMGRRSETERLVRFTLPLRSSEGEINHRQCRPTARNCV
jgi:eukaryotic-like serine/threonine-protein kinase